MAITDGLRPVRLEALGDDFAQVEGEWLQGVRIAQHLARAIDVWAFSASDVEDVEHLLDAMRGQTGLHAIALSPGMHPDWPIDDEAAVRRLLPAGQAHAAVVGLLMTLPPPDCACPHRGNCAQCGGCGTNAACPALYVRPDAPQTNQD